MKNWFITGANRGLGLEVARAALENGDRVIATARRPESIHTTLSGYEDSLIALPLDVTSVDSVNTAMQQAVSFMPRIDVLVNNAGFGQLGAFEELSSELVHRQFETNVFGVFNVTRAVLPIMRAQKSGHIVNISSTCGITGFDGASLYCATKFAISGWSESLSIELARFGIKATCVYPGPFRTDFLDNSSVVFGDITIDDYQSISQARRELLSQANHQQNGDPVRFGHALVKLVESDNPPVRWGAGSNAYDTLMARANDLRHDAIKWHELSKSTDIN